MIDVRLNVRSMGEPLVDAEQFGLASLALNRTSGTMSYKTASRILYGKLHVDRMKPRSVRASEASFYNLK